MNSRQSDQPTSDAAQRALDHLRSGPGAASGLRRSTSEVFGLLARGSSTTNIRVGIACAGVILSALFVAIWFVGRSPRTEVQTVAPPSTIASAATTTTTGPSVVVDVGGAVRQPGVYRLAVGSRVVDALESAGGPADDIDLDHINLAATVTDGQRVWISRRGELPPIGASTLTGSSGGSASAGPLDLNTATLEQLDALTGVGPATAKAIIDRRTQLGRFRSVDDLLTVKGIGSSKLDSIRSSVVVR